MKKRDLELEELIDADILYGGTQGNQNKPKKSIADTLVTGAIGLTALLGGLGLSIYLAGKYGGKVEEKLESEGKKLADDLASFQQGLRKRKQGSSAKYDWVGSWDTQKEDVYRYIDGHTKQIDSLRDRMFRLQQELKMADIIN